MMTLEAAIQFFITKVEQSKDKSNLPIYRSFLSLLQDLQSKELNEIQMNKINEKLNELNLDTIADHPKKELKKAFSDFNRFLKEAFSFMPKGYYSGVYMSLGMSIGMSLGISMGIPFGMPMGMIFGMIIGMGIGMSVGIILGNMKDGVVAKEGRVITSSSK